MESFVTSIRHGNKYHHLNGDLLDNRKENIAGVADSFILQKGKKRQYATSIYKGVYYSTRDKKWIARVNKDKKVFRAGRYNTEKEAGLAYNKKALELYGEFSYQNKI